MRNFEKMFYQAIYLHIKITIVKIVNHATRTEYSRVLRPYFYICGKLGVKALVLDND